MGTNNVSFLLILVFSMACVSKNGRNQRTLNAEVSAILDSIGQAVIQRGNILGFSISIDSAGQTIYNGTYGYIDSGKTKPVEVETRFDIASVSKLIGVSVIMKLIDQRKLELDQTLDELLPDFPEIEQARVIKLSHLISNTSGLPDYALQIDSIFRQTDRIPSKQDFLDFFRNKELFFQPGSNYQYCNSGFMMMAFIAENVTKKSWQQLVNEVINTPTGLDFQLIKFASDLPEMSPIFDLVEDEFKRVPTWVYVLGDGGLTATAEVLSKFPSHWTSIIQQNSFEEMITPKSLDDYIKTGYGFGVRRGEFLGEPMIGHTGGWKSTYAIMAHFPARNLTFAGLMNTDDTPASMGHIFCEFMLAYLDMPLPDNTKGAYRYEEPEQLTGMYHGYGEEFDNKGTSVNIKLDDGQLFYCVDGSCNPLYYIDGNKFWLEKYPFDIIEFQTNEKGHALALREYYYGFFQVLRKKVI